MQNLGGNFVVFFLMSQNHKFEKVRRLKLLFYLLVIIDMLSLISLKSIVLKFITLQVNEIGHAPIKVAPSLARSIFLLKYQHVTHESKEYITLGF